MGISWRLIVVDIQMPHRLMDIERGWEDRLHLAKLHQRKG